MSSKVQKDKGQKQNSNQAILSELLKEEENRYCSDCGAKGDMEYTVFVRLPLQVLLTLPEKSYFLGDNFSCFSFCRAAMGVMESGRFSLYPLCRDSSKLGRPHIKSEIREP